MAIYDDLVDLYVSAFGIQKERAEDLIQKNLTPRVGLTARYARVAPTAEIQTELNEIHSLYLQNIRRELDSPLTSNIKRRALERALTADTMDFSLLPFEQQEQLYERFANTFLNSSVFENYGLPSIKVPSRKSAKLIAIYAVSP